MAKLSESFFGAKEEKETEHQRLRNQWWQKERESAAARAAYEEYCSKRNLRA
jgi:hypothetical protein